MATRTELGKIQSVRVGMGGYQDVQMGVWFVLSGTSWGVHDGHGTWSTDRTEHCKWTEGDRNAIFAEVMHKIMELLKQSSRSSVDDLVGLPIEATFDGNTLRSWRLLTEVL